MKALTNSKDCPQCGNAHKSKPFCVFDNGSHCFSCGYSSFIDNSFSIIKRKQSDLQKPFSITKPSIPLLKKLLEYNITEEKAKEYGILFGENDSVIYPITNIAGEYKGYQERQLLSQDRRIVTNGETACSYYSPSPSHNSAVVIVEDFLSAKRVAEQHDVVCLWGTSIKTDVVPELLYFFNTFYIWLDNDKDKKENSGQKAAQKIIDKFKKEAELFNIKYGFTAVKKEFINIVTEKDPKYYTNSEISKILGDNYAAYNKSKSI